MSWLQLSLTAHKGEAHLLELLFLNMGALSVTFSDAADKPVLEPAPSETPLWSETRVTALFEGHQDPGKLRSLMEQAVGKTLSERLEVDRIEDQAWERAWLDAFHPMRFGSRLWVCPDGQRPEDSAAVALSFDPGLAFGTGNHPSTRLCLKWLDGHDLAGKTITDYGCGSGILAIAALCLGAARAIAIDHDPQALDATRSNAAKNQVSDRIQVFPPDQAPLETTDVVLANILAGTLIGLADQLAARTRTGGRIVLSGILRTQMDSVSRVYRHYFSMQAPREDSEWVLLEGRRFSQA